MDPGALLELLKRRTGFTEAHAALLRDLGSLMAPMAPEVALAFYDYLGRDEELGAILHAVPGRVERLYGTFARWYAELFSGTYDRAYAEGRRRVGLVHARLGIGPRAMIPAMGVVQELSLEHMRSALRGPEIYGAVEAFEKIIAIEVALIEESYLEALSLGLAQGHLDLREALAQGAATLLKAPGPGR
ncbi:protoglobin domain-containing protein [Thermus amyloliquefaciens]|uniref:protoglobin domain-containing protein n=1 Tax=Thermus amyloliquefaciens TaxID=1449080 RepID=UPI00057045E7|nr:protoglobin domain-containing protein [Thermus amyloliquefaciens]